MSSGGPGKVWNKTGIFILNLNLKFMFLDEKMKSDGSIFWWYKSWGGE